MTALQRPEPYDLTPKPDTIILLPKGERTNYSTKVGHLAGRLFKKPYIAPGAARKAIKESALSKRYAKFGDRGPVAWRDDLERDVTTYLKSEPTEPLYNNRSQKKEEFRLPNIRKTLEIILEL